MGGSAPADDPRPTEPSTGLSGKPRLTHPGRSAVTRSSRTCGEAPADEVAAAFALALASRGFVTTTMKGFTSQEIGAVVSRLP